jgi:hypothetical protein
MVVAIALAPAVGATVILTISITWSRAMHHVLISHWNVLRLTAVPTCRSGELLLAMI